jgi:hypothetical protein
LVPLTYPYHIRINLANLDTGQAVSDNFLEDLNMTTAGEFSVITNIYEEF